MSISRHRGANHRMPHKGQKAMGGPIHITCSFCKQEAVGIAGHIGRKHRGCNKKSQWRLL